MHCTLYMNRFHERIWKVGTTGQGSREERGKEVQVSGGRCEETMKEKIHYQGENEREKVTVSSEKRRSNKYYHPGKSKR